MNQRNKNAIICQGGASNERKVAAVLLEAIDECRAENVSPREDPAVFLILHQLAFLLTGHDFSLSEDRLAERWNEATKEVEKS